MNLNVVPDDINEVKQSIIALQRKLKKKSVDLRIDVVYFIVTVIVFLIFISIIFMDTYQNIKTYFQRSNVVSNKTRKIPTDDNEYLESTFTNRSDISKLE